MAMLCAHDAKAVARRARPIGPVAVALVGAVGADRPWASQGSLRVADELLAAGPRPRTGATPPTRQHRPAPTRGWTSRARHGLLDERQPRRVAAGHARDAGTGRVAAESLRVQGFSLQIRLPGRFVTHVDVIVKTAHVTKMGLRARQQQRAAPRTLTARVHGRPTTPARDAPRRVGSPAGVGGAKLEGRGRRRPPLERLGRGGQRVPGFPRRERAAERLAPAGEPGFASGLAASLSWRRRGRPRVEHGRLLVVAELRVDARPQLCALAAQHVRRAPLLADAPRAVEARRRERQSRNRPAPRRRARRGQSPRPPRPSFSAANP